MLYSRSDVIHGMEDIAALLLAGARAQELKAGSDNDISSDA